jgi:antitoxin PrlF
MGLEVIMAVTPTPISESTLTDRYQTTIPDAVRKVLGLNKRGKIRYTIKPDGQVIISRADTEENDPVLEKFLTFLAADMEENPQHLQAIDSDLVFRAKSLVVDVDFDLNAPLLEGNE